MEDNKKSVLNNPLASKSIWGLLVKYSVPSIISLLVNSIYNIVDQMFVGNAVGTNGIGATTIGFSFATISLALALLCGVGGASLASIRKGEGNDAEADKILGSAFVFTIILTTVFSVLGSIFLNPMLKFFGATADIFPYAQDYVSIILIGAPFVAIATALSHFIRAGGNPNTSMLIMLSGAVINTALDAYMVTVLKMGVSGAALATTISQIISAVISIIFITKKGSIRLKLSCINLKLKRIRQIFGLGFSSFVTQSAFVLLQFILNNSLVHYGDLEPGITGTVALSAMGGVTKINGIFISVIIGISIGAQPIIGFNKGMGNHARVKQTYKYAVTAASVLAILSWLFLMIFPEQAVKIFGNSDSSFTDFAAKAMRVSNIGIFCAGFQIISSNFFQASGQPLKASCLSMSRQLLLLIPFILILPLFFGLDGILYATPISDVLSAVIVSFFIFFEMKKLNRLIKAESV